MMENLKSGTYCKHPKRDKRIEWRDQLFGDKDETRNVPIRSFPFHRRNQENQGFTPRCVLYSTAEIIENKVFEKTGRWYRFTENLIDQIWARMVDLKLASDSWGAYLNGAPKALQGVKISLVDEVSGDTFDCELDRYFYVSTRRNSVENFTADIQKEIAFGGGVLSGVSTRSHGGLDYRGAKNAPYYIEDREDATPLAHAICLTGYDNESKPDTISSSGTWGDNFGDKGVVYLHNKDLKKLMRPIGFTIRTF